MGLIAEMERSKQIYHLKTQWTRFGDYKVERRQ